MVDGRLYTHDIIILPQGKVKNWRRAKGHLLQMEDLDKAKIEPETTLVVGTGASGIMRVPKEVITALREKGIEVIPLKTAEAVIRFNNESSPLKAAALHLTC